MHSPGSVNVARTEPPTIPTHSQVVRYRRSVTACAREGSIPLRNKLASKETGQSRAMNYENRKLQWHQKLAITSKNYSFRGAEDKSFVN